MNHASSNRKIMQRLSEIHRSLPSLLMHSRRKKGFYPIITLAILFEAVFCNSYFNLGRGVVRSLDFTLKL